mgnify:CR=1 FL=1
MGTLGGSLSKTSHKRRKSSNSGYTIDTRRKINYLKSSNKNKRFLKELAEAKY